MDYVLEDQIHTVVADAMYQNVISGTSTYCYFMGGKNGTTTASASPTYKYELETRNNILATKRIGASDISFVVPRNDWKTGVAYDQYDDNYSVTYPAVSGATSLVTAKFFVLTDEYNVYKCIKNAHGGVSTVKPTGTTTDRFDTADGYIWKYMYSIPPSSRNKFLNNNYMPVQTAVQEQFYSSGKVLSGTIVSAGTGYTTANVTIAGDGTGATATLTLNAGQIASIIMTDVGTGYTYATMNITGDGTGAVITPNFSMGDLDTFQSNVELLAVKGTIENIVIENGGHNYTNATVTIFGDGIGATATATITAGAITDIVMTNVGSGYTFARVVVTGAGVDAVLRAIISPIGGHGKNPVQELCARRLLFYTTIAGDKNQGFSIANNFQQIGILRNIREFSKPDKYFGTTGSPLFKFTVIGTAVFLNDEFVNSVTGARYKVFAMSGTDILVQNFDNETPLINMTLNNTSRAGQNHVTAITQPTVDKFSGEMLYIDNVMAIQSSSDQIVTFKTSIKF